MQAISIQRALTFGCVGVRRWLGRRSCDQHSPNVFTRNIFSSNDAGMVHILQLVLTGQDLGPDNLLDCRFFLCDIHLARGRGRDKPTGRSAILFGANPLGERGGRHLRRHAPSRCPRWHSSRGTCPEQPERRRRAVTRKRVRRRGVRTW